MQNEEIYSFPIGPAQVFPTKKVKNGFSSFLQSYVYHCDQQLKVIPLESFEKDSDVWVYLYVPQMCMVPTVSPNVYSQQGFKDSFFFEMNK